MPRRYLDRRAEVEIEAMLAQQRREQAQHQTFQKHESGDAQKVDDKKVTGSARRTAGDWRGLVEQRILDGMEQGLFDNLRGEGKPLNLDEDQFVPDDLKMAFRLLHSTGLAPLWVDLNKEIRQDIERLHRFRVHVHGLWDQISDIERTHRRHEYERRIKDINSKIMNYNIVAPSSHVHFGLLLLDDEMARFDQPETPTTS
jgi:hypothetical protein